MVIDLRNDRATTPSAPARQERPTSTTRGPLPQNIRLGGSFPPYQRVVHHGPINGRSVDVKLTGHDRIELHSTGIEFPMTELAGRLSDEDHLRLLIDAFGRDQRLLGSVQVHVPNTLIGAKQQWYRNVTNRGRYGFALNRHHLVLLQYRSPNRDPNNSNFGVAYKRIVKAYAIS